VEDIDVGEAAGPRQVCSSLVAHVPMEQMEDSLVLVVCNLKSAKMRGVESQAMVLCACVEQGDEGSTVTWEEAKARGVAGEADAGRGEKVELLRPPQGSVVGERLTFEGVALLPPPGSINSKRWKKIWPHLEPGLRTLGDGALAFRGRAAATSGGVVVAEMKSGAVR